MKGVRNEAAVRLIENFTFVTRALVRANLKADMVTQKQRGTPVFWNRIK